MDITSVLDQSRSRAFPELSPSTAARVDDVLTALARLDSADAGCGPFAIAGRQLVRATRRGDMVTRKRIRACMHLIALRTVA